MSKNAEASEECLRLLSEMGGKVHSKNELFKALNIRLKRTGRLNIGKPTFGKILSSFEEREFIKMDTTKYWHGIELTGEGKIYSIIALRPRPESIHARPLVFCQEVEGGDAPLLPTTDFSRISAGRMTLSVEYGDVLVGYMSHGTFVPKWHAAGTPVVLRPMPGSPLQH